MQGRSVTSFGLAIVLGLSLVGCAARTASMRATSAREFAGHYASGPEGSWFYPCGAAPGDLAWWATLTGRSVVQVERERVAGRLVPGRRCFVCWNAVMRTDGLVGPRGMGAPALLVQELLELRPASDSDCTAR